MPRDQLADLVWFLTVAEERNFTRAAARLGVSQSTLSHAVKRLEGRIGLRLLNRTTRSVATTEAGERLRRSLAPRFAEIETELASVMELRERPAGRIRISLSDHALQSFVWPKLKPVLARYPDLQVEFSVDNAFRNIVEEGFDAGVRLGESVEADMIALRISPDWRLVVVAAPDFIARHERPRHPRELVGLNCVNHRHVGSGSLYAWEFEKDGEELKVRVTGQLTFNGSPAMLDAALSGLGIALMPEDVVAPYIASGALILLLDEWSQLFPGYHLYYPGRQHHLPAFRVVADALRHRS